MIPAALLLLGGAAHAGPVTASGSFKDLWQYSASAFNARPYFLNLDRARLTLDAKEGAFDAHVDYDQEAYAGSFFRTPEYAFASLQEPPTWLNMDWKNAGSATSLWRHRFYRAWGGYEDEKLAARFGRQRIAWGTGKFWNPTDILNPYQPTQVEKEERTGVDAFYVRAAAGELSQGELAYAPQSSWPASAILGRWKGNARGCDWSVMGGKSASSTSSWVLGGDFAGNLWDGSLRGEWSYSAPKIDSSRPFWKAVLGYEYTFSSNPPLAPLLLKDASTMVEYYHNGAGTTDVFHYNFLALLSGRVVGLGKDYLGASYSRDLNPLLKLEWTLIANLDDLSHFFGPSLQWNPLNNLYLTAGLQRFAGSRLTEYGRLPNLGFLQAQYFF